METVLLLKDTQTFNTNHSLNDMNTLWIPHPWWSAFFNSKPPFILVDEWQNRWEKRKEDIQPSNLRIDTYGGGNLFHETQFFGWKGIRTFDHIFFQILDQEIGEGTFLGQELPVGASLTDPTFLENDDSVHFWQNTDAMRHKNSSLESKTYIQWRHTVNLRLFGTHGSENDKIVLMHKPPKFY